jgi:hypothetical protein
MPVSAPNTIPSSGPLISPGAARTIMMTPHTLSTSSLSGADREFDQLAANVTLSAFAHSPVRPMLPSRAQPIAAEAPQTVAAADQSSGGLRTGRASRSSRKATTSSGSSRTMASSVAPGKMNR